MDQIATTHPPPSPGRSAMPITPWDFANALLRRVGIPPGVVPVQVTVVLSTGLPLTLPIYPPSGPTVVVDETFVPTPAQVKILQACRDGGKTATQLKLLVTNLYRQPGGIAELQANGLLDRAESGRYVTTEIGREWVDSQEQGEGD